MENLTVKDLRSIAKRAGVSVRGFRKAEMLTALSDIQPENLTVKILRTIAKKSGVQGFGNMRKEALINAVGSPRVVEANVPVPGPVRPIRTRPARASYGGAIASARREIIQTTNWIRSNVRDPNKRAITKRLRRAANAVRREPEFFIPERHETALRGFLRTYIVKGRGGYDPTSFLSKVRIPFRSLLYKLRKPFKLKCILSCGFTRRNNQDNRVIERSQGHFHSLMETVTASTDTLVMFDSIKARLVELVQKYENERSGWVFESVIDFRIHVNPFQPFSGTSYIKLPPKLAAKKAIINVKNEDQECFKWAVTSAVFPRENHPERLNKEMRENSEKFDWSGIEFPVAALSTTQIDRFERQNSYGINILGYENGGPTLIRRSNKSGVTKINLLLISNEETNHYCWIKNMSRLIEYNKKKGVRFYCDNCLNSFNSQKSLDDHMEYCLNNEAVKVQMPMEEDGSPKYITFTNHRRKMQVPFVIYADFECFTEKLDTCFPDDRYSFTNQYQKHKPSGFCYLIKCFDDEVFEPKLVMRTANSPEDDIPQMFQESLEEDIKKIYDQFKSEKKLVMKNSDHRNHRKATHCHICEGELVNDKVVDHCHFTGRYRGAAHRKCNLEFSTPKFFPVIFHNLSGYDSHLFIKKMGVSEGKIDCIPLNDEKYISFTKEIVVEKFMKKEDDGKEKEVQIKRTIRFIDSFRFMASGLARLADNLPRESLANLSRYYEGANFDLLARKGVFPYDWFDGFDKLQVTNLPPKDEFYSILYDTDISDDDYQHAGNVWETFGMRSFRDYHDLYLKTDVVLLADVFENFRGVCMKNYGLDPAWHYTAPGLAWDATLKITKVELELLRDPDMLIMVENGIRGGISTDLDEAWEGQ